METKLLLLGLLRREDMHGYRLAEFIEKNLATCVNVTMPTAYRLLNQMVDDGWISFREERVGNRPPRRVYHLLPAGEQAFERLLRDQLARYEAHSHPSDIPLAFMDALPTADQRALLSERRAQLRQTLAALQQTPAHPGPFQLMIEHQTLHLTSELEWLDRVLLRIDSA